jgi:hypothetical protein
MHEIQMQTPCSATHLKVIIVEGLLSSYASRGVVKTPQLFFNYELGITKSSVSRNYINILPSANFYPEVKARPPCFDANVKFAEGEI